MYSNYSNFSVCTALGQSFLHLCFFCLSEPVSSSYFCFYHQFSSRFPPIYVFCPFPGHLIGTVSAQSARASAAASHHLLPGSGHMTPSDNSGHMTHALASSVSSALMPTTADSSDTQAHNICTRNCSSQYTTDIWIFIEL